METKKFILTGLVVFIVMYILDYLFHGMIMQKYYKEILDLLRPEDKMLTYLPAMLLGQIIIAFGFTYIFIKGYEGRGIKEGVKFGLIIGIFFGVAPAMINYAVYKITGMIMLYYFFWYPLEGIIMGAVAAAMYTPKTTSMK